MSSSTEVPMASSSSSSSSGGSNTAAPDGVSSTLAALAEGVKSFIGSTSAVPSSSASASTAAPTTVAAHAERANVADISSSLQHFGIVDYMVFVVMLIICAVIGFYFGFIEKKKKKRNIVERRGSEALDYLVGGRKMKVFPVSLSLVASFVSGISLLGTSTEIYVYGTQYAFILITLAISGVISWYVFLPVFCNLQLTSTYEYFERRFSRRMRIFGAALFTIKAIIWMPIAIYVPALTLNQVSGIDVHTITPIVIVICTFYTTVGGLKGVVWTDVIQSFVMFGAIIVLMVKGTYDIGGINVVWQRNLDGGRINAPDLTLDPTVRLSVLSVFVGGVVFKIQSTSINQPAVQRFMSLPSLAKIKQCLIIFSIGVTLLYVLCVYVGLLAFATYHDCDPMSTGLAHARDQLVPLLVMRVLGMVPGLPGLFVSGVFSAALSSLSTLLNSMSAVVLEDFVKPNVRTPLGEQATAIVMRSVVVVFGISSIGLVYVVEHLGMVLQLSATLQSSLYGPMLGIFTAGMMMPWLNEKSVLTGSVISFVCMACTCIKAQMAHVAGTFPQPKLPVSVEGCNYDFDMGRYLNSTAQYEPAQGSAIHHMSFLLYALAGATLTLLCSNLAALVFGFNKIADVDEKLLAPFVLKYLKGRKYQSVSKNEKMELSSK